MKDLCLFDLDGTLTDPKVGITKSVSYALDAFGIKVADLDGLKHFIGPPLRDSFREFYGFTEMEVEDAVSKYREYYSDIGIFENTIYDGIVDLLSYLKGKNVIMVIATSKPTVFAERIAEHFDIRHYFELIVGSELDGTRSLKSEIINCALSQVDPERKKRTVMIGDRKHDIIGARETGINSIGVTWGYGLRSELESVKATWIADSPNELLDLIVNEACGGVKK